VCSSDLTHLAPVLNVRDLGAERAFYEALGLPVTYEATSTPISWRSRRIRCIRHSAGIRAE